MLKKVLSVLLVLAFVGTFFYTLYFLYTKDIEPDEIFVTTTPMTMDIIKQTVATGSVIPRKEVEIKPQMSGIIQVLYVAPGDEVKKDDVIAKLTVIPDMISLNNAEDRLRRAQIQYENDELEYKRYKTVFENKVIAEIQFQTYELALKNASQELEAAADNLNIVREGISKKTGELTNTLIRSTIDGMILDVPVEVGNSVIESNNFNDGTTIAFVADLNDMVFEGHVDESEVGKIHPDMDIILKIGAIDDEMFNAKLEFISPKGIEIDGAIQFQIRAALELNDDVLIRAGYSANAYIILDKRDMVLAINERLLQYQDNKVFVEIEQSIQNFKRVNIELGLSDGINVEVLNGLKLNDRIKDPNKIKPKT